MEDQVKFEEETKLKETTAQINQAIEETNLRLKSIGEDNLEKLADLRANPETGVDFEIFLQQLQEKNVSADIKGKYQRLEEYDYLVKNPYFARIDLKGDGADKIQKIYIGKFGFGFEEPVVTDWRASIASIYYRYRFPQKNVEYKTIEGVQKSNLELKRTFDIFNGQLIKYYNNDIQLDENEIIVEKIKTRTGGVLEDIIETIQNDQMEIIESDPRQICIVQGCVGSGKSTVAIHKLAHIFFNYPNYIHPERAVLVVKSQILIGYLATLFPKLGIFDINFKTLRDLLVNTIFREELNVQVDFDDLNTTINFGMDEIKNIYHQIDSTHKLYQNKINDIFINPDYESYGGYKYSNDFTVYENLDEIINDLTEEIDTLKENIKENPSSIRALLFKSNVRKIRNILRKLNDLKIGLKKDVLPVILKDLNIDLSKKLNYLNILIFTLVYKRLIGFKNTQIFEYCLIDEGQDFSLLELAVLSSFVLRGRMGIFGDLNQMIYGGGITNWEDIQQVIPEVKTASVFTLETNYRSTKQIIDLANKIMTDYSTNFLPKSINRMGSTPYIETFLNKDLLLKKFIELIKQDAEHLNKSIGIICTSDQMVKEAYAEINKLEFDKSKFVLLDPHQRISYLPKGIYLMSINDCKGLEFSKVYLLDLNLDKIKDIHEARRAFVGVTRAMNDLAIFGLK